MSLNLSATDSFPREEWTSHVVHSSSSLSNRISATVTSALLSTISSSVTQDPVQNPSSISTHPVDSHKTKSGHQSTFSPFDSTSRLDVTALRRSSFDSPTITPTNILPTKDNLPSPNITSFAYTAPDSSSPPPSPESSHFSAPLSASPDLNTQDTQPINTGAIAGGVVGGVAFLVLFAAGALLLVRHRRKSAPPPSAEFMHLARGPSELGFATMDGKKSPTLHRLISSPLTRRGSLEDEENLPPLSPTLCYRDPVLEKAQESAAMREKYIGSEEGGYQ